MTQSKRAILIGFLLGVATGSLVLAMFKGCSPPPIRFPSIRGPMPKPTSRPVDFPAPKPRRVAR